MADIPSPIPPPEATVTLTLTYGLASQSVGVKCDGGDLDMALDILGKAQRFLLARFVAAQMAKAAPAPQGVQVVGASGLNGLRMLK